MSKKRNLVASRPQFEYALPAHEGNRGRPEDIDLGQLMAVLHEGRWMILACLAIATLAGATYAWIASPIYSSDSLLQIEGETQSIGTLGDISDSFGQEAAVAAETEILQSRLILGEVVDDLRLDVETAPAGAFARIGARVFGASGPHVAISALEMPRAYQDRPFTLIAGRNGRFDLRDPDDRPIVSGAVGELIEAPLREGGELRLFVGELTAEPGARITMRQLPRLAAIDSLRNALAIEEQSRQSGILRVGLEGEDPELITAIVNGVVGTYVRQNVERKSAEAATTLDFLERQIPLVKDRLTVAEAELNDYRLLEGSVDLPQETRLLLDRVVVLEAQLSDLNAERPELLQRFTPRHSRVVALDAQVAQLEAELKGLEARIYGLPDTQQEVLRLSREVEVESQLYTLLLNRAQELRVARAGTVGNVRVIDEAAVPYESIKPNKLLLLLGSPLLGLLIGVIGAALSRLIRGGVRDPAVVEREIGPVYASVLHSSKQRELLLGGPTRTHGGVLAIHAPNDLAIESLRGLRTTLNFTLQHAKNRTILVTGPRPEIGKSFLTMNLAALLASAGKSVTIIDADMRSGCIGDHLGVAANPGLADFIKDQASLVGVVQYSSIENLRVVAAGTRPANPAELLSHERFAQLLKYVEEISDYVIIDSPPILAVADATIISRFSGVTLLVAKSGLHPVRELEESISRLEHAGVDVFGVVMNDVKQHSYYEPGRYAYPPRV